MIWFTEILKIYLEEQRLIKYYVINHFDIAKNLKYDGYQHGLASMVYKFFDKKSASFEDKSASGSGVKSEIMPNQELTEELHKPIIRKFEKGKVYSTFKDKFEVLI